MVCWKWFAGRLRFLPLAEAELPCWPRLIFLGFARDDPPALRAGRGHVSKVDQGVGDRRYFALTEVPKITLREPKRAPPQGCFWNLAALPRDKSRWSRDFPKKLPIVKDRRQRYYRLVFAPSVKGQRCLIVAGRTVSVLLHIAISIERTP